MYVATRLLMITFFLWSTNAEMKLSEYDEKHRETIIEWHKICEDVTGMKDVEITSLKAGDFSDFKDNIDMKKYLLCMWRVSGIMSTNLEFHRGRLEQYIPKRLDSAKELNMVQGCLDEGKKLGKEKYDKIFKMQECLYKKNPTVSIQYISFNRLVEGHPHVLRTLDGPAYVSLNMDILTF